MYLRNIYPPLTSTLSYKVEIMSSYCQWLGFSFIHYFQFHFALSGDLIFSLILCVLQRLHEENEKLFDRLTEKATLASSPKVNYFDLIKITFVGGSSRFLTYFDFQLSSPLSKGVVNVQHRDGAR